MARQNALWISFDGQTSSDLGVRVAEITGIPAAEARGKAVEIPGRDGTLWLSDGAYKDIAIKIDVEVGASHLEAAAAWLSGAGALILSVLPEHFYAARVTKGIDLKRGIYAGGVYRGTVEFTCAPFRYLVNEEELTFTTPTTGIRGQGTWTARPVITVYGQGHINLMVNRASVLLSDVDDHITLDCDAMMAFKDGVNMSPGVTIMENSDGEELWPELSPDLNQISWSTAAADTGASSAEAAASSVARVVVQPNWRWR